jgi:hypothetical protein
MEIAVTAKKELGEKYPAVIYKIHDVEDGLYGPQFRVSLVELDGNKVSLWLSVPATERNRTGRIFTSMNGKYPEGSYDPEKWEGLPVHMIYAQKKGGDSGELVLDMLKPREAGKTEKPADIANKAQAQDDLEAPF